MPQLTNMSLWSRIINYKAYIIMFFNVKHLWLQNQMLKNILISLIKRQTINVMGASKRLAELIIQAFENRSQKLEKS